jgi:hypothetical protein
MISLVFCNSSKNFKKTNKKTKILNIVEENHHNELSGKSNKITHLFDDLNDEN